VTERSKELLSRPFTRDDATKDAWARVTIMEDKQIAHAPNHVYRVEEVFLSERLVFGLLAGADRPLRARELEAAEHPGGLAAIEAEHAAIEKLTLDRPKQNSSGGPSPGMFFGGGYDEDDEEEDEGDYGYYYGADEDDYDEEDDEYGYEYGYDSEEDDAFADFMFHRFANAHASPMSPPYESDHRKSHAGGQGSRAKPGPAPNRPQPKKEEKPREKFKPPAPQTPEEMEREWIPESSKPPPQSKTQAKSKGKNKKRH
jgi:hypothetical protein